jgi:penicillin-binding protein 1A
MLRDVIQQGTARKARVLGRRDIAGKTGTTNDQRDAWFNGFNHHIVTVAWLGFDNVEPLGRGEVGGRAALPAWIDFMQVALNGIEEKVPDLPSDMITMRIDVDTGEPVGAGSANAIFEVFETKNAPTPVNSRNPSRGGSITGAGTVAPAEDPF